MKLKRMGALWFGVEKHNNAWRLTYKMHGGCVRPVSELATELGCTMKTTGDKAAMSRRLEKLKSIMEHYEFIGWSVDEYKQKLRTTWENILQMVVAESRLFMPGRPCVCRLTDERG